MRSAAIAILAAALCACGEPATPHTGSPADALPPQISRLLETGMRPDWSADGRRLLFLDALVGDVFEVDVASRAVRPITKHFAHRGFTRARYLASGDILLCGPREPAAGDRDQGRWTTELWWLGADLARSAQPLGEPCFEGPAVSRRSARIAWTRSEYPERVVLGRSEIWTGEIAVESGAARLVDRRMLLDRSAFHYLAFLETQDFRPPDERELLFTAYAWKGGEVMGVDLETGEIRNYSLNWGYDEAEGVFPDGRAIAVEREPGTYTLTPSGRIDIWRTALDGSGDSARLTHFSDFAGYGANNPAVSPDGRWMAFGLRELGGPHGNGHGIFLYDLRYVGSSSQGGLSPMTVELNHTIVPARDKEESARFYERMFGFEYVGPMGHFTPVKIPSQSLTLDFDQDDSFAPRHYAFKVSEAEFDEIFGRVVAAGLAYGSGPFASEDMKINHWNGGRGVYFRDPSGHLLELLTRDYTPDMFDDD